MSNPKKKKTIDPQLSLGLGPEKPIRYVAPDRNAGMYKALPQSWTKIAVMPKGGKGMVMGELYRFQFEGQWFLLRWLPWGYSVMNTERKGKMARQMKDVRTVTLELKLYG